MTIRARAGLRLGLGLGLGLAATAVLVASVLAPPGLSAAAPGSVPPGLVAWVSPSRLFALHKPPDWKVTEDSRPDALSIGVASPDGLSRVALHWSRTAAPGGAGTPTAVSVLRSLQDIERKSHPDATFSEAFRSADGSRAVAVERYRVAGSVVRTRTFVEVSAGRLHLQSYTAPEATLASQRPLLMNVLSSVAFIQPPPGNAAPPPIQRKVSLRRAADGSLAMKVPEGWAFLAAGGKVVAGEPGAGFIFTAFAGNPALPRATVLQGVLGTTYRSPSQTLPLVLTGFGHRGPAILEAAPNQEAMRQCPAYTGRSCAAEDLLARWTSKEGIDTVGAFTVVNTQPGVMGQWSSIVAGIWGPRKEFLRWLPLLEQVAGSFSIDDRYAKQYIQAGLANLARLQRKTAEAIQSLNYARQDMQKAWEDRQARKDYVDSKWDDYRRGNSYWVSDLEGGKVYATETSGTRDTTTGDYYGGSGYGWTNFTGQNPRHPSESMREVSSWELDHGAPPK